MDRLEKTSFIVKDLNKFLSKEIDESSFIKKVCSYFDGVKHHQLTSSDLKFLKYLSNVAGIPHYYDLLFIKFGHSQQFESYDLNTFSAMFYESSLHIDENIKIHKYQKQVLEKFNTNQVNRFFLSATTSFGKTFLIYEIIKKLKYKNVVLIFPTIALLSENYERLISDSNYNFFNEEFSIHTLSETENFTEKNIFIFTPERYLSFIDKNEDINVDFVFVDEIYKIDNEYLIDAVSQENERDTAYRVALNDILKRSQDVLLVGPYIEFPDQKDQTANQSFHEFLDKKKFSIINFNDYEIVNKTYTVIRNRKIEIDDELAINLKGFSNKRKAIQIAKVVSDIRQVRENSILYTKGAGTAEKNARHVIEYSERSSEVQHERLTQFIEHLVSRYKYDSWIVIEAIKNGVGVHHGLVPKYIQKEIVSLFNDGYLDTLISTTTITEGVNTSAKNLIVLNARKGNKDLKTFDAKNIAGRAGRFLHHYSGRVLILDKKFLDVIEGSDNEIKHKNYDKESIKDEIDYFITDEEYLNPSDIERREGILEQQRIREIPSELMAMYKVISHSDKIIVFDQINELTRDEFIQISVLIRNIKYSLSLNYDGFKVIENVIKPIVQNKTLLFFIDRKSKITKGVNRGKEYSLLTYMLSAYLKDGFLGSVEYNLSKGVNLDEAFRKSSSFIFSTLKYQLVKYLGVFNIMYKYQQSKVNDCLFDEISGLDKLLLKLEYNASSDKGRLASDYGVPSKITEYYDSDEQEHLREQFDQFEMEKFRQIEAILENQ